ncbi:acyl-CoA thioester hydrolase/BAAT C-terminal domain-containing protein [Natrarchaeobius sp. A-rgal3]|uniref:acyl-CoA thioester hydrolase/BAAT C-terminal domain-containing protein n=1 Tax=Natrarchaeobius versutus TaxID=1679078 RepID=UPI003510539A
MDTSGGTLNESNRRRFLGSCGAGIVGTMSGCLDEIGPIGESEPVFDHPDSVRIDESFPLEIGGLPTGEQIEVIATADDDNGVTWSTTVTYEATDGTIDLETDAPLGATDGEAGTGRLIQSMETTGGEGSTYAPPPEETLSLEVAVDDNVLGTSTMTRTFGDPDLTVTELDEGPVGVAFEPPGSQTVPAVVVLHASEAEPLTDYARMLASNGFVALALHYYGTEGLPDELVEVPLELVDEAATWLLDHDRVEDSQVGLFGRARGGELALLAGSRLDSTGPVVSLNGSGVVIPGLTPGHATEHAWTVDGDPIPHFTGDDDELEAATIAVEENDGPVLLVSGAEDLLWESTELTSVAQDRLEERDFSDEYDHLVFDDAGHAIRYPYVPTGNRERLQLGGTSAGYARADATYWPRALEALRS